MRIVKYVQEAADALNETMETEVFYDFIVYRCCDIHEWYIASGMS